MAAGEALPPLPFLNPKTFPYQPKHTADTPTTLIGAHKINLNSFDIFSKTTSTKSQPQINPFNHQHNPPRIVLNQSHVTPNLPFSAIVSGSKQQIEGESTNPHALTILQEPVIGSGDLMPISQYQGKPAITFTSSAKEFLVDKLKYVLVGKFSHGRPSLIRIKEFFSALQLKTYCNISVYDKKHIFIECACKNDYNRIWLKLIWFIECFPMRIFKWTADFSPLKESSIVPVWLRVEGLPLYLFHESSLMSIGNSIGKPIKVDPRNVAHTLVSSARICVELDVSKPLLEDLWIGFEDDKTKALIEGFWVKVYYDVVPFFCGFCSHLGHKELSCMRRREMNNQNKGGVVSQGQDLVLKVGLDASSVRQTVIQEVSGAESNMQLGEFNSDDLRQIEEVVQGLDIFIGQAMDNTCSGNTNHIKSYAQMQNRMELGGSAAGMRGEGGSAAGETAPVRGAERRSAGMLGISAVPAVSAAGEVYVQTSRQVYQEKTDLDCEEGKQEGDGVDNMLSTISGATAESGSKGRLVNEVGMSPHATGLFGTAAEIITKTKQMAGLFGTAAGNLQSDGYDAAAGCYREGIGTQMEVNANAKSDPENIQEQAAGKAQHSDKANQRTGSVCAGEVYAVCEQVGKEVGTTACGVLVEEEAQEQILEENVFKQILEENGFKPNQEFILPSPFVSPATKDLVAKYNPVEQDKECDEVVPSFDSPPSWANQMEEQQQQGTPSNVKKVFNTRLPIDFNPEVEDENGKLMTWSQAMETSKKILASRSLSPAGRSSKKLTNLRKRVDVVNWEDGTCIVVNKDIYAQYSEEIFHQMQNEARLKRDEGALRTQEVNSDISKADEQDWSMPKKRGRNRKKK